MWEAYASEWVYLCVCVYECVCMCVLAWVVSVGAWMCACACISLPGVEILVIACMVQTISPGAEKIHIDFIHGFTLYPFIWIFLEHLLCAQHYARLDATKRKKQVLFSFLRLFAICKVMVLRVESEFTLMFPKMYSRILLTFYQKNKKKCSL